MIDTSKTNLSKTSGYTSDMYTWLHSFVVDYQFPCDRMNLNTGATMWQDEPQYWPHLVTGRTSILVPPCDRTNLNTGATMWQDEPQYWCHHVTGRTSILAPPCDRTNLVTGWTLLPAPPCDRMNLNTVGCHLVTGWTIDTGALLWQEAKIMEFHNISLEKSWKKIWRSVHSIQY